MSDRKEYWRDYRRRRYQEEPEFRQKEKERHRNWRRRTYDDLKDERNARRRARYVPRPRKARVASIQKVEARKIAARPAKDKPIKQKVSAEVRALYSKAHPNSAIKRAFPKRPPTEEELSAWKKETQVFALREESEEAS